MDSTDEHVPLFGFADWGKTKANSASGKSVYRSVILYTLSFIIIIILKNLLLLGLSKDTVVPGLCKSLSTLFEPNRNLMH